MWTRRPAAALGMVGLAIFAGVVALAASLGILSSDPDPALGVLNSSEPVSAPVAAAAGGAAEPAPAAAPGELSAGVAEYGDDHEEREHDDSDDDHEYGDDHEEREHDVVHADRARHDRDGDHDDD